jgi:hypothetical protein
VMIESILGALVLFETAILCIAISLVLWREYRRQNGRDA